MPHTPTPWIVEDADGTNNHQHCKVYALVDGKGKVIADCHNSEVADIQCDPDEYGSNCWDEQGRQDFEFISRAANSHDELVAALRGVIAVADRNTAEFDAARAALSRATAPME